MTYATKKEANAAVNAARTKAQKAAEAFHAAVTAERETPFPAPDMPDPAKRVDRDAASAHYQRCIAELEQAINDAAPFDNSGDDD